jgi:hypothetical protein
LKRKCNHALDILEILRLEILKSVIKNKEITHAHVAHPSIETHDIQKPPTHDINFSNPHESRKHEKSASDIPVSLSSSQIQRMHGHNNPLLRTLSDFEPLKGKENEMALCGIFRI